MSSIKKPGLTAHCPPYNPHCPPAQPKGNKIIINLDEAAVAQVTIGSKKYKAFINKLEIALIEEVNVTQEQ